MNIGELIKELKLHKKDMRVIVRGYEGGVVDIDGVEEHPIALNVYTEWYYGPHEIVDLKDSDEIALLI